jgi:hypothetical protein
MILNINGKEIREFCAYSPKYKLSVHQIYEQARSKDASEFLLEVIKEMTFKIKDILMVAGNLELILKILANL